MIYLSQKNPQKTPTNQLKHLKQISQKSELCIMGRSYFNPSKLFFIGVKNPKKQNNPPCLSKSIPLKTK